MALVELYQKLGATRPDGCEWEWGKTGPSGTSRNSYTDNASPVFPINIGALPKNVRTGKAVRKPGCTRVVSPCETGGGGGPVRLTRH